mgnify:CR=1 FL=1
MQLLFLMLLRCDLKKIIKLGPKCLLVSLQPAFLSVLVYSKLCYFHKC